MKTNSNNSIQSGADKTIGRWFVRFFRRTKNRRTSKAIFLRKRAQACEQRAFEYERSGDTFRAGKMAGQAKIYNMWASSLTKNTKRSAH